MRWLQDATALCSSIRSTKTIYPDGSIRARAIGLKDPAPGAPAQPVRTTTRPSSLSRRGGLPLLLMALSWPSISGFVVRIGSWSCRQQHITRRRPSSPSIVMGLSTIFRQSSPYCSSPVPQLRKRRPSIALTSLSATTKPSVADDLLAAGFPKDLLDYVKNKDLGDEWYEDEDDDEEDEEGGDKRGRVVVSGDDEEEEERGVKEGKEPRKGTVHIRNSQRGIEVDQDVLQQHMEVIMGILGRGDHDVSLWLTNDRTIREYNDRYRGKRKATDILSFGFHEYEKPEVPTQASMTMNGAVKDLGDMIISVPYVKRQCERDRKDTEEQGESLWTGERGASGAMADIYDVQGRLPYLVIHGVLHLLGHDHETDEDYAVMVAREEELIAEFHKRIGMVKPESRQGREEDHSATVVKGSKEDGVKAVEKKSKKATTSPKTTSRPSGSSTRPKAKAT